MLQDHPRNKAYRDAILSNKDDFKDKIVLDIGAGSGILSVFVPRLELEPYMQLRPKKPFSHKKVDIIVSEWMGFYLLHEAMLNSVIVARDKFLKPDGLLFPESATLYSVPCSVPSMFDFWESVDGVSMQHFGKSVRENASKKPITELVSPESLLCDPEVVIWLDLREVTLEDINTIQMRHIAVANKQGKYQGIFLFLHTFDVCMLPT
ncbi:hypothetical protein NQ314_007013 [Rhamnusium bicolor]|uniref:Protein arginine N-methyltransferase domain-containing protein n=1 Tax=Rhamnusium bicolor TaxID=1586634 RepID=A0AAV8YVX5_9CUCU|nr:hypothetical protein NQ314_007013 [Rhamnusium bicolor]